MGVYPVGYALTDLLIYSIGDHVLRGDYISLYHVYVYMILGSRLHTNQLVL